jgi:glycosyltransferase involved in cell wall biosynthesis
LRVALFVHCFFPSHFYGTETYTLDVARNLNAFGHTPLVVSAVFPGEPAQSALIHRYEFRGIPVFSIDKNQIPHTRVRETYYQPNMIPVLRELIRELKPDIAHVTHLINHTGALIEALVAESVPTVATFTDFFGFCYNNRLEAPDGRLCSGPNASATNCLACHLKARSVATANHDALTHRFLQTPVGASVAARGMSLLSAFGGSRSGRITGLVQDIRERPHVLGSLYRHYRAVITPTRFLRVTYERNGFAGKMRDISFGTDLPRHAKPPRQPNKPLTLGFIGQLAPHKGPDLLIEAAEHAMGRTGYEVKLYGSPDQDPAYVAQLKARAADLPVHFPGTFATERMREVLDDLDALVIPSRWCENSPLVLLNALASHTPVIISDVEGMTEFVQDGVNGYSFPRGNAAGLTRVLRQVTSGRADLEALSQRSHYDMTTRLMTEKTIALYEEALDQQLLDA